jgi:F0F1-type ATP synthase membrane subunit a
MRKLNIKTRRNIILTILAITLYNVAAHGFNETAKDVQGFGIPVFVFAGIGFLATLTALTIRLWNDAE